MSSEFLEKIRNIIVTLLVLFISILNTWIAFCSLPVHAEESTGWGLSSNAGNYYHSGTYTDQWGNECSVEYYSVLPDSNYFYGFVRSDASVGEYDNVYLYSLVRYQLGSGQTPAIWDDMNKYDNYFFNRKSGLDDKAYSQQTFETYYFKNGSEYVSTFNCSSGSKLYIYSVQPEKYGKKYHEVNLSFSLPVFNSYDAMLKYCLAGDTSGLVNGGSIDNPNFQDAAYAFTGFTANNKMTATWTGTTERTYLQDQEVEEYVRVNYYFADKEAQDTIKQADAYPDEFATADKTLTIDVSGLKPDNENWFLRYIRITPCYRQAGLGAWGDFYHGSDVYVYFDVNGKVESIVQNSVPTDGEVIGNNISLIGFRYDTSFHAEFVDVWSNAVNCSAFDLGGSQYLSLGVKALYYNGQSKDIDFVSLDRKNLVWDKTFDSFKTFNGSGIKQLFFTPYIKTGVNNPWNKGNSIVIDFDVNGNATSSFDTGDDGTVHLSDFKLTGVVWNKPMLAYGTITWTGTTANSDMSIVPDSDTLVVCSYPVYDSSLNESYETYDTVTIGKGSIRVYIDSLIDKYTNAGKTWNGEMWLTPCYKKGGVLYMGEPVIVNCTKGTVSDIEVDESTGTANQVDKTDENKSYADAILSSGNNFFSIVKGLIASMQQLPELIATLFSFLPGWVNALIAGSIFVIFVCRILGR